MKYITPFVAIDNVFVSRHFVIQSISVGPYIGSDHRPLIADITLVKPAVNSSSPTSESAK
jgi:endonuclease/exonuclease/phosphatase family metal-dependent hydrolase